MMSQGKKKEASPVSGKFYKYNMDQTVDTGFTTEVRREKAYGLMQYHKWPLGRTDGVVTHPWLSRGKSSGRVTT